MTISNFWTEVRRGFTAERAELAEPATTSHRNDGRPEWNPADDDEVTAGFGGAHRANAGLQAKLDEANAAISDLVIEVERLKAELKQKNAPGGAKNKGDERYKRLKVAVAKHLHPDTAGSNQALAAALDRLFKELRSEIDRLDQL